VKSLRQAVIAARDLTRVQHELCQVLGLEVSYHDPNVAFFGLVNAVMPVGQTFLEVVSPVHDAATAHRFLERRGSDAGYMLLVQTDDLAGDRKRLEHLGVRSVWSADLDDISAVHLHPRDTGGAILSLDQPRPAESWRWAGPEWQRKVHTNVVEAVVGAEFRAPEPEALAARWAAVLGERVTSDRDDALLIELDHSRLRFSPLRAGLPEGLTAIELRATDAARAIQTAQSLGLPVEQEMDAAAIVIGGTRLRLCSY
jgi:hypothetical protein